MKLGLLPNFHGHVEHLKVAGWLIIGLTGFSRFGLSVNIRHPQGEEPPFGELNMPKGKREGLDKVWGFAFGVEGLMGLKEAFHRVLEMLERKHGDEGESLEVGTTDAGDDEARLN